MAKQLNVNLAFTADTRQAKAQLLDLQNTLNKISTGQWLEKDLPITKEIIEAQNAAKELQFILNQAFDINSGKLDLSKFNQSLKQSGMSLVDYSNKLTMLGKQGDQAFLKLAQSIIATEAPIKRSSALLGEMWTTMKNTARWQISSSILHGFMGAISSAMGYAQDLNSSLNNIRIVTGQNVEQMAAFAEQANRAAKALSTTTTEYTNASLIYYQQGLSDEEVQQRTNITIKMANAAGASAEQVSDQLTAVWNNFYDGSKSLEYYADVMTALGAATASSTDEIAGGLEKFAAIGDTIGLSYEYAASALATITSNTRQSEEVVGTALKTIFARIQGLSLGETLDDGTNLNKYSEALSKIGITIFEQNGELKTMDNILNEMASRWETLDNAQQTALAQTVAGVRQYTQLVALMENWDNGDNDSMMANLNTSYSATGTLQEQADIYAESWEASQDRVKASMEGVYQSLIDEEFFIELNDTLADLLKGVELFVDGLGGMKGVLFSLISVFSTLFKDQLGTGINNALQNFRNFTGASSKEIAKMQKEAYNLSMDMTKDLLEGSSTSALRNSLQSAYEIQTQLQSSIKKMSPEQAEIARSAAEMAKQYHNTAIEAAKAAEEAEELWLNQQKSLSKQYGRQASIDMNLLNDKAFDSSGSNLTSNATQMIKIAKDMGIEVQDVEKSMSEYRRVLRDSTADDQNKSKAAMKLITDLDELTGAVGRQTAKFAKYNEEIKKIAPAAVKAQADFNTFRNSLDTTEVSATEIQASLSDLIKTFNSIGMRTEAADLSGALQVFKRSTKSDEQAIEDLIKSLSTLNITNEAVETAMRAMAGAGDETNEEFKKLATGARVAASAQAGQEAAAESANEAHKKALRIIAENGLAYKSLGSFITGTTQSLSSLAMGLSTIKGLSETLANDDLSGFEKTFSVFTSLSMSLPMITSGLKELGNAWKFVTSTSNEGLVAQIANLVGEEAAELQYVAVKKIGNEVQEESIELDAVETYTQQGYTVSTKINTVETIKNTAAKIKNLIINKLKNPVLLAATAAVVALTAAIVLSTKAYNKDSEAAKRAAEAAKSLGEESQKVKQELEDVVSTFDNYNKLIDTLESCKNNTEEWNNALKDVNESIWSIIEKYPDLLKIENLFDENGQFNQEAIDSFIASKQTAANNAQAAAITSSARASQAQVKSDATDLTRWITKTANQYGGHDGTSGYHAQNMVNAILEKAANDEVLNVETLLNDYASQFSFATNEAKDAFINALLESSDKLLSLSNSAQAANNQMENVGKIVAGEILGNDVTNAQKDQFAEYYSEQEDILYNQYLNAGKAINSLEGKNNLAVESLWNSYLAATGKDYKLTGNAVQGSKNNRVFEFYNEDNEKETITVEQLASVISSAKVTDEATALMRENILNSFGKDISQDFKENTDIALLNSVAQRFKLDDEGTQKVLEQLFNSEQTASEQNKLLQELINSSYTEEEKEKMEADSIASSSASKYELDSEIIAEQAKQLHNLHEEQGLTLVETTKLAVENQRMNQGLEELIENWEDWNTELAAGQLDESRKGTADYAETIRDLTKTIAKLVGASENLELPDDFFDSEKNLKLIEKAANGSEQAIEELGVVVGKATIDLMELANEAKSVTIDLDDGGSLTVSADRFESLKNQVLAGLTELQTKIADGQNLVGQGLEDILSSGAAGSKGWIDALNEMALATSMSVDQMNELLASVGMEADVTVTDVHQKVKVPVYKVIQKPTGLFSYETRSIPMGTEEHDGIVQVAQINANTKADQPSVKYIGNGQISASNQKTISDNASNAQSENFDKLQKALEFKLKIDDSELEKLEYLLNKFSDEFYLLGESAEHLLETIDHRESILSIHEDHIADLTAAYKAGQISAEDYNSGLNESKEAIYEQLNALLDLDKQMREYYGNTLDEADEELEDHTDHLEHLSKVFDHYVNLMDIFGKSKDYEAMDNFLQGRADIIKADLDTIETYYDGLIKEKDEVEKLLADAAARGDEEAKELYEIMLNDISDKIDETQDQMLEMTEEWAEAMKKVFENTFNKLSDELEKALTDGMGFDSMLNDFDLLNQQQEEFLTKTNQIYETNKLMRTATKAMDDTSNKAAKQKIKNYIEETKKLQNTTRLSKYELEIQQAKYDLLLAEIALEEAQNAKSTVRLTRDNEGNFGYIYTADQDEVDDAQQQLEDAQNNLYNIQYEGQQNALTKFVEAEEAYFQAVIDIQQKRLDGEFSSEEDYRKELARLEEAYYGPTGILTELSRLYNITLQENTNATAENMLNKYGFMTDGVEQHAILVQQFIGDMDVAWNEFQGALTQIHDNIQNALNNSEQATKDLKDESEALAEKIKKDVLPAIEQEIIDVREATSAYALQRGEILRLIDQYEDYIDTLKAVAAAEASVGGSGSNDGGFTQPPPNGDTEEDDKKGNYPTCIYCGGLHSPTDCPHREKYKVVELNGGYGLVKTVKGLRQGETISVNGTNYFKPSGLNFYVNPSSLEPDPSGQYWIIHKGTPYYQITALDTGGYTGDWGPEGKLAMLHEKELVLNAADTSNILSAVSIIREIARDIDARASMSNLSLLTSAIGVQDTNQVLEQMVSIEASFPNATDRYEIEEAFNSLVNKAAQYANRK